MSSEKNVEFKDDDLYYQFTIEDLKSLKLMDLLNVKDTIAKQNPYTSAVWPMNELYNIYHGVAKLNIRNSKGERLLVNVNVIKASAIQNC